MEELLAAVILEIYRAARTMPLMTFQDSILKRIQSCLPFDASIWGVCTLTADKSFIHCVHYFRAPAEWQLGHDPGQQPVPGIALLPNSPDQVLSIDAANATAPPESTNLQPTVRRHCCGHSLAILAPQPGTAFWQWISLIRHTANRGFSAFECQKAEVLLNHAMEALNTAQILDAHASAGSPYAKARAFADPDGRLYHASPDFLNLLAQEMPDWAGPTLPALLCQSLEQVPQKRFLGRKIVVHIERTDAAIALAARRKTAVDELSARQLQIARLVASGETHKEIARHLGITPATARNHIAAIYKRLGIANKAELITQLKLAD